MLNKAAPLLDHFARLATVVTRTTSAMLHVSGPIKGEEPRHAAVGLRADQVSALRELAHRMNSEADMVVIPDTHQDQRFAQLPGALDDGAVRFLVFKRLLSSGQEGAGFLWLFDAQPRCGLSDEEHSSLEQIANVVMADRQREQRHRHLMHVADRALRVDRMLRLVSEAPSCADALISLLEELCHLHGASIGQISQLIGPDEPLIEISRYDGAVVAGQDRRASDPLADLDQITITAINNNKSQAIDFSKVNWADIPAGMASRGLFGYVCLPIWVHQQRFGIVLAFPAETAGLETVAANIAALGDTIRPTLFQKVTEERIRHAAYHDDLTQLSNRLMFQERLRTAIATARTGGQGFAVLCLDLDGFKRVNDTFGHGFGDNLLVGVAQRLRQLTDVNDTVARTGGDEFAIIQPTSDQPKEAVALAERLLEAVSQPLEWAGRKASVGLSIGIAIYGVHGDSPDVLMRRADQALYRSKQSGRRTYCVYDPEIAAAEEELFLVERDLKDAIGRGEFTLAYQPVFDTKAQRIVSFEALLRWHHPLLGWIPPDKFITVAERNGLIDTLGRWVLETACSEATRWDRPVSISVNLSPLQFRQPDLTEQIAGVLGRTGLPADRLILEVTEGLLLDESDHVVTTMRMLQAEGIRVVLDDFGTAYASMSYLRRFPFDGIKIDKSFVRGLHADDTTRAIVETILSLASRLKLAVVAEGVETERELDLLRQLGCSLIQGYLVGRPLTRHHAQFLLRQSLASDITLPMRRTNNRFEKPHRLGIGEKGPTYQVPAAVAP